MLNGRIAIPFLVLVLLFSADCARKKFPAGDESGVSPGVSTGTNIPSPQAIFPHPDHWKDADVHGPWVVRSGSVECLKCHKGSSDKIETPPACNSCHPLYPHPSGWGLKENHGRKMLSEGKSGCATQCHGTDLEGGLSGIACTKCHEAYPHPADWKEPLLHGEESRNEGRAACRACHGEDLLGGDPGVGCFQCHDRYPHDENWKKPENHGQTFLSDGKATCATECHGTNLKGGLAGVSCSDCHADFPHPDPAVWDTFTGGHGEKVTKDYKGSTATCEKCHGADLKRGIEGKNCFSCHGSYPHTKVTPETWTTYEGHGEYGLLNTKIECQLCHGADYLGGSRNNRSCRSCHKSYPHLAGWRNSRGEPQPHGEYVTTVGKTDCASSHCHGVNLQPVVGVTQGGGCDSCHKPYPHSTDWGSGVVHGRVALSDISDCTGCHGAGLDQAPAGHQSCKGCHPSYLKHQSAGLPSAPWGESAGHGTYVQTNLPKVDLGSGRNRPDFTECQLCHGDNLQGGISQISCYRCHDEYPHSSLELPAGTGWASGGKGRNGNQHALNFVNKVNSGKTDACQKCHGVNYATVVGGFQCTACHTHSFGEITHRTVGGVSWKAGMGHGRYFTQSSGLYRNQARFYPSWEQSVLLGPADWNDPYEENQATFTDTQVGYCRDCHGDYTMHFYGNRDAQGEPTTQVGADTIPYNTWGEGPPHDIRRGIEASETSCYDCHWAYPHGAFRNYEYIAKWVEGNVAHGGFYVRRHPFFMVVHPRDFDPNLHSRVPRGSTSPLALQATCAGGTAGTCHNGVRRPENRNPVHAICVSCH